MHYHLCDITSGNLCDIIIIMCFFFALFVNVQYFSVVLYMFNIYTGVQMSFVDR